jgi:hypothetical protein
MPNALEKGQLTCPEIEYRRAFADTHTDAAKRKPHDDTYTLRYKGQFIGLSGSLEERECDRTSLAIGCCARSA